MSELVSVCIATNNREYLLPNTIKSVQNQTYKNLEIFVVDDASTDGTKKVVEQFIKHDKRIKYIRHVENKGLAAARNTAIFNSTGKYFTFIDDDDQWDEIFIEEFVKLAESYDERWCFCCGFRKVDGRKIYCVIPQINDDLKHIIYNGYTPPITSQFYFLSQLKDLGGYNEQIKSGVDHDLWLKLAVSEVKIKSLEKCLSIPNTNIAMGRMTTTPEVRNENINKSLEIWKPMLQKHFANGFYEHFVKSYKFFNQRTFFVQYFRNKHYIKALKYFYTCPFKFYLIKSSINKLILKVIRKYIRSYIILPWKPLFFPFKIPNL